MTKEKVNPLSFFLITLSFISYFSPSLVIADEKCQNTWEYSIQNGFEYSKRSYLLVYRPQTDQERRINVFSQCRKALSVEGIYGTCTHALHIQPTNVKFALNTGEDVVLVQASWDAALIIGTFEYGCCGGPDTVRFYSERGKYLGSIDGARLRTRFNYENMITRILDAGNSTRYGWPIYFAVKIEGQDTKFQAIVIDGTDKMVRIPILFTIPNKGKCREWYLSEFINYGDRKDLTLKMSGFFCENEEGVREQVFRCSVSEKAITCTTENKK